MCLSCWCKDVKETNQMWESFNAVVLNSYYLKPLFPLCKFTEYVYVSCIVDFGIHFNIYFSNISLWNVFFRYDKMLYTLCYAQKKKIYCFISNFFFLAGSLKMGCFYTHTNTIRMKASKTKYSIENSSPICCYVSASTLHQPILPLQQWQKSSNLASCCRAESTTAKWIRFFYGTFRL